MPKTAIFKVAPALLGCSPNFGRSSPSTQYSVLQDVVSTTLYAAPHPLVKAGGFNLISSHGLVRAATSPASRETESLKGLPDGSDAAAVDRPSLCHAAPVHRHLAAGRCRIGGSTTEIRRLSSAFWRRSSPFTWSLARFNTACTSCSTKLKEYISFIILLGALYVISGGIYVKGSLSGTPLANTALMAIGAVLASIIGTTGASVLLIRPLLRANKTRVAKAHIVVFFIFVVSNCGGLLTPLGDPPLFLGFLKGVPFLWTLERSGPSGWWSTSSAGDLQRL